MTTFSVDALMTAKQAAAHLGEQLRGVPYAVRTIYNLRSRGDMPEPDEIRRGRPRWRKSTLDQWIRTQITTSQTGAGRQSEES